jgi:hypothetical protein
MGPAEWRSQTVDDRALMVAYELFNATRDAYRDEWKEERRGKKNVDGINPYEAMKAQMGL